MMKKILQLDEKIVQSDEKKILTGDKIVQSDEKKILNNLIIKQKKKNLHAINAIMYLSAKYIWKIIWKKNHAKL